MTRYEYPSPGSEEALEASEYHFLKSALVSGEDESFEPFWRTITPGHFQVPRNALVYAAMWQVRKKGIDLSPTSLICELDGFGKLSSELERYVQAMYPQATGINGLLVALHAEILIRAEESRRAAGAVTMVTSPLARHEQAGAVGIVHAGRFEVRSGDVVWCNAPDGVEEEHLKRTAHRIESTMPPGARVLFVPTGVEPVAVHSDYTEPSVDLRLSEAEAREALKDDPYRIQGERLMNLARGLEAEATQFDEELKTVVDLASELADDLAPGDQDV